MLRENSVEPKPVKSKINMLKPTRKRPHEDTKKLRRPKHRSNEANPAFRKFNIETEHPSWERLLGENGEPGFTKSKADTEKPVREEEHIEAEEPRCSELLGVIDAPVCKESSKGKQVPS